MTPANRSFAPLAAAHFLTSFNSNFMKNALVFLVVASLPLHEAEAMSSFVSAVFMLPMIFMSGFGGQLADRYDRSVLSTFLKAAELLAVAVAAVGVSVGSYWITLAGVILLQVVGSLFGPVRSSLIPSLVAPEAVPRANAWIEGLSFAAMISGLWFVGFAFGLPSDQRTMATIAVLLVAALSFSAVRFIPKGLTAGSANTVDWNLFKGTWRTLMEAVAEKTLVKPIIILGWSWFVASLALSTAPALVARTGGSSADMSWLMIAYGVAGAVAAQVVARVRWIRSPMAVVSVALAGQAIAAAGVWAAATHMAPMWMSVALCLLGALHAMVLIPLASLIQTTAAPERRARSAAASNIINAIFMVVGGLGVAGVQAIGVSLPVIYAVAAIGSVCAAMTARRVRSPARRDPACRDWG
jgi:Arabinose efflux permease